MDAHFPTMSIGNQYRDFPRARNIPAILSSPNR